MTQVKRMVDINVPLQMAYNQWTQFETFPEFMEGVERVQQIDDRRMVWRANVMGQVEEWDAEITEQIPDKQIAWKSVSGAPNSGMVTFDSIEPDRTLVTVQLEYEPRGALEKIGDMLGIMERRLDGDLRRFKEFIESRQQETGAWRGRLAS